MIHRTAQHPRAAFSIMRSRITFRCTHSDKLRARKEKYAGNNIFTKCLQINTDRRQDSLAPLGRCSISFRSLPTRPSCTIPRVHVSPPFPIRPPPHTQWSVCVCVCACAESPFYQVLSIPFVEPVCAATVSVAIAKGSRRAKPFTY